MEHRKLSGIGPAGAWTSTHVPLPAALVAARRADGNSRRIRSMLSAFAASVSVTERMFTRSVFRSSELSVRNVAADSVSARRSSTSWKSASFLAERMLTTAVEFSTSAATSSLCSVTIDVSDFEACSRDVIRASLRTSICEVASTPASAEEICPESAGIVSARVCIIASSLRHRVRRPRARHRWRVRRGCTEHRCVPTESTRHRVHRLQRDSPRGTTCRARS